MKINYYLCLAREKQLGPIDKTYLRPNELSHVFFMVQDDEGKYHFVYPHTNNHKYEIDELPPSISGTTAILLSQIDKDSVKIKETIIPGGTADVNYCKKNIQATIDLASGRTDLFHRITFSGAVSTLHRMDIDSCYSYPGNIYTTYLENLSEDDSLKFDTAWIEYYNEVRPFKYRFAVKTHNDELVNSIGDNLFSVNLEELIMHDAIYTPEYKRTMNYGTDFPYSDCNKAFLVFNEPVKLANSDDFPKLGLDGYDFKIKQLNPTTIQIESEYIINKTIYSKEEYLNLIEINKAYSEIHNASLMVEKL